MSIYANQEYGAVTIASGESLSGEIEIGQRMLIGLVMPSAWTAASLTFQHARTSGGTFLDLYDQFGNEVTVPASASRYIAIQPAQWCGMGFLKVRSGTSGAAVNQGAARTIGLVFRQF